MSEGWENYEPAPLEYYHGKLMDAFHEFRKQNGNHVTVEMSGNDLNNLIANCKLDTYKKYPEHLLPQKAILKTEFSLSTDNKEAVEFVKKYILFNNFIADSGWFMDEKEKGKWKLYNGSDETGAYFKYATDEQLYELYANQNAK